MTSSREHTMLVGSTRMTMTRLLADSEARHRRSNSVTSTTLTGTTSMAHKPLRWRLQGCFIQRVKWSVDTSRWWLMRWPRNATALLVRAGNLQDDEASKLFRALRVAAIRFGLELAALPKARRDAEDAANARTALRKRWVAMVGKL